MTHGEPLRPISALGPLLAKAEAHGLGGTYGYGRGTAMADLNFNQDGLDDLYLGRWDKQDYLLLNQGGKRFVPKGYEFGLDMALGVEEPCESREVSKLFVQRGPKRHNTATLELRGTVSNADAIGAHVTVSGSETRYYTVRSAQAFQSQNSLRLVLSPGDDDLRDVRVVWPSGLTSEFTICSDEQKRVVEASNPGLDEAE